MHKNKSIWILVVAISLLLVTSTVLAAPKVTKVELGAAVNDGYYAVVFKSEGVGDGIWINPGDTSGDTTTTLSNPALAGGQAVTAATMFGSSSGYGQMLFSIDAGDSYTTERNALDTNYPTNANTAMFGESGGPVNKNNIELGGASDGDRAIDAGTEVTFTVNMNSEVPHLVAVMGGSAPTVTYDASGTGTLTIKTTTFGTTTNADHTFYSIVGFMIYTVESDFGDTPLRIIAQTNHWVGDVFPLLPGVDSNAAVEDIGGDKGTITAKCGTTIAGSVGESRTINIFFPDDSIAAIFGRDITNTALTAFENSTEEANATIDRTVNNFGKDGTLATFTYEFASKKDTSVGVDTTDPTVSSTVPASDATGVATDSNITATFSEDMDSDTITTSTFTVSTGGANIEGTVSYSSKTATFNPSSNMSCGTTYTATLTTGIKDEAGNALAADHTWDFSTVGCGGGSSGGCFIDTAR